MVKYAKTTSPSLVSLLLVNSRYGGRRTLVKKLNLCIVLANIDGAGSKSPLSSEGDKGIFRVQFLLTIAL